jgi:hypothetical protein
MNAVKSFQWSGSKEMRANLRKVKAQQRRQVGQGLAAFGEAVIDDAKQPDQTPVMTGALRNTLSIEGPLWRDKDVSIRIIAGGPSAPYAVKVHEDLNMNHPNGGKAKFLEDPLTEKSAEAMDIIGQYVTLQD